MPVQHLKVDTVGSAGSALGSVTTDPISGFLLGVRLDYAASAPATTDVTITETGGLERTILTRSNSGTDGHFNPFDEIDDATGTGTGTYMPFHFSGTRLQIAVAQSDALSPCVAVTIEYGKMP